MSTDPPGNSSWPGRSLHARLIGSGEVLHAPDAHRAGLDRVGRPTGSRSPAVATDPVRRSGPTRRCLQRRLPRKLSPGRPSHGSVSEWLPGWTGQAEPLIDLLPTVADHPVIQQIYPREAIDSLLMLWERRDTLYEILDRLPQTLCHNDVFPRNLFSRAPRRAQGQAWPSTGPSAGPAAVGQELATLVGATQVFRESSPERWEDLERDCLHGYTTGLRAGGSA